MSRRSLLAISVLAACGGTTVPVDPPHRAAPDAGVAAARVAETPQPTLRLPDDLAPSAYRARLVIDPAQPTFTADLEIDAALVRPASVIWLHAVGLTIDVAEAQVGGETVALTPELRDGLVAFRAARDLPAGPLTLHVGRV